MSRQQRLQAKMESSTFDRSLNNDRLLESLEQSEDYESDSAALQEDEVKAAVKASFSSNLNSVWYAFFCAFFCAFFYVGAVWLLCMKLPSKILK